MSEFWNFKDAFVVAQSNWIWLIAALVIGMFVGWATCRYSNDDEAKVAETRGNQ